MATATTLSTLSNSGNTTETGRQADRILTVPHPAAGAAVSVDMVPGNGVHLPFNPGDATASRSGNDLTFTLDDGGSVTIANFFVVEEGGGLPPLVLPGGEEVPSEVAFADANFDLETAAGPGAGAGGQGSGAGEYADDPGNLLAGIDRLGSLGTIYWDRNTEVPETYSGVETPGGSFDLGSGSDLGGLIGLVGAVYEDGLPYQHLGDRETLVPGQLVFSFSPTGSTVVDGIHLTGFPEGTVIYFGDPADPGTRSITVGGPNQQIDFTEQDFANGVYFIPPKNSDANFTLTVEVDLRAESSGLTTTIGGTTTVVVDAVADRPELGENIGAAADSSTHVAGQNETEERSENGYNEVTHSVSAGENGGGATVTVTVSATFDDYLDGSEHHYILVETNGHLSLDTASLPAGYVYTGIIVIDGVEYHQIGVDNSVIEAGNGSVSLPVIFQTTGDADEKSGRDEHFDLKVGAYAEEDVNPSGEIDLNNNQAHIVTEDGKGASAIVDVVNGALTVTVGWASEGNNAGKHGNGAYAPDYSGMDGGRGVDSNSTNPNGAPISISLSGAEGSSECITSVELTFDAGRGNLCVNGDPVHDGMTAQGNNGVTYSFSVDPNTGTVTITVTGGQVDSLDELGLTFRPSQTGSAQYDDSDVGFSYKVNVSNEAGAKGVYEGKTEVIVDAVADKPELGENVSADSDTSGHVAGNKTSDEKYEKGFNEEKTNVGPGEGGGGATVTVTVTATFGDYLDGSESHSLLVQTDPHLTLDLSSLPDGYTYVGTIVIDGVEYHQIAVDNTVIKAGDGTVSLPVTFQTTGDANEKTGADESFTLKVGAYAEENVASGEFDTGNNKAHDITEVTATVDVINATLAVTAGWASEGNNAGKHVSGAYKPDYAGMDEGDGVSSASTGGQGAPISISLSGAEGSSEYITSAELTFDAGRGNLCVDGTPVSNGMTVQGNNGVTYSFSVNPDTGTVTVTVNGGQVSSLDELGLTFRPDQTGDARFDDSDVGFSYKVNVSNEAGAKGVYEGKTEVVIDAVADKPVNVGGDVVDYNDKDAAVPGEVVDLTFTATFPDTSGTETHTIFIRVDGNNGLASHNYGDSVISGKRIGEVNGIAGNTVLAADGDYLELQIPPLSEFTDGAYTFADLGITITYNGNGKYTVTGVRAELPDKETLADNGALNTNTGNTSMDFGVVGWAREKGGEKGSSEKANNEHDADNNNAFTSGNATVDIATVGKGTFTVTGGTGFENDQPHNNLPENPTNPAGPDNNSETAGGVGVSVTWKLSDSQEYVSSITVTVPLDRFGNPVGEIVYRGVTYTADGNGVITIPVDALDAKKGISGDDMTFVPTGHGSGTVELDVTATVTEPKTGETATKDAGTIEVGLDAVANRSGEVTGKAEYDGNSAVATGDPVTISVTTTFSDNDGSERHYVLVQQNPHWEGAYTVEYYDLDGDGVKEPYFKVPVPDSPEDFPAGAWNELCENGTVTFDYNGVTVTVTIPKGADGKYDPSGDWTVEARVSLDPPALSEGKHSVGTGSLVEETDINHSTENRGEEYKDNNTAMRPGNVVEVEVNNTEGINVKTGFLYEAGREMQGGDAQDGVIHITPSSGDDSFFGELTVSIPSGHGDFYYNGELLAPGADYPAEVTGSNGAKVSGTLRVVDDGKGSLTVTFTPDDPDAGYKGLDLELGLRSDDYSDTDIKVSVEGNLRNDKSGQETTGVGGKGEVLVDAVAEKPGDSGDDLGVHDKLVPGGDEGVTVTITASFEDTQDNSEAHFFLLEAKPGHSYTFTVDGKEYTVDVTSNWPTVPGPDGTVYYKIPASPDASGSASLDVEIKVTQPYFGGTESDIKYGALSEDTPSDTGEHTYDNNIEFTLDGSLTVGVDLDAGDGSVPVSVDIAYENNTPNADTGDDTPQYAKITLPDDATEIRLDPGEGTILFWNGTEYVPLEAVGGWVTISPDQAGNVYYKVPENCDDTDLSLKYEIVGGKDAGPGSAPVYVDAVAQQGSVDKVAVDTGDKPGGGSYSHVGEGPVTVTVSLSGLVDQDGSTTHYVLVQAKPGWECLENNAELVLIDGVAYFRVPVDAADIKADGTATVDIRLQSPTAGTGGVISENLAVGSMVVDTPTDKGEYDMDNNIAVNVNGSVTVNKSVAETTLNLTVSEGYEDNLGDPASISVSGVGSNDVVTEIHLAVDADEGVFTFNGEPIGADGYSDAFITITVSTEGGKTVISITSTNPDAGLSGKDLENYVNGKLGLAPATGNTSNKDIEISWGYEVKDTLSGDTAGKNDGKQTVVIDAVAHKPEVTEYEVDYGAGRHAAEPGDAVAVKAVVTFTRIPEETDYVLVQFTPGWEVNGISLTVDGVTIHFTADEVRAMDLFYPDGTGGGGAYYKVPLEKEGTKLGSDVAGGDAYEVEVSVNATTPSTGIAGDTQGKLGIGGVAVDSYADGETSLANNVASDVKNQDSDGNGIVIGIVDSTGIDGKQVGEAPEEGAGNSIAVSIVPTGGSNDVITELTLTVSDKSSGTFFYDGQELEYVNGKVILPPSNLSAEEKANWVFDTDKLEFRPGDTFGGKLNIKVEATVSDAGSGASKDDFKTSFDIEVTPVATQPTELEASSKFSDDGGVWTVTLSAVFADTDGSEQHFFLFKIPRGLTLDGQYPDLTGPVTGPDGTEGWYKIPVDSKDAAPSIDLGFRADSTYDDESGLEYHAGASENGKTAWADAPDDGNAVSPKDDGGFDYRTEHVDGDGDFSEVGENLLIYGSDDDDVIFGGSGNDVIHAGGGETNIVIGGEGNDTLYGSDGQDTFFWDSSHFGADEAARDVVLDFEYQKDVLRFDDVFGDDLSFSSGADILDILDLGKGSYDENQLQLVGDSCTLTAEFNDTGVSLSIDSAGAKQTIEVSFGGSEGAEYQMPDTAGQAAEILAYLISQGAI